MSGVFSRSTLAPTIAFFCLEHVFDKTLDLCVDFHVPAFANGVETDNLLIFSLIYSSPEMMEALNSVNVSFLAPTRSSGSHSVCLSVCLSACLSVCLWYLWILHSIFMFLWSSSSSLLALFKLSSSSLQSNSLQSSSLQALFKLSSIKLSLSSL